MKEFKVYISEQSSWSKVIEAKDEEDAREKGTNNFIAESFDSWKFEDGEGCEVIDVYEIKENEKSLSDLNED